MGAALQQHERERIACMTARLSTPLTWRERILRELAKGPATTMELAAVWGYGVSRQTRPPAVFYRALRALITEGLVIERPELQPARRCVVDPVMVLELASMAALRGEA